MQNEPTSPAVGGPLDRQVRPLLERLRDAAMNRVVPGHSKRALIAEAATELQSLHDELADVLADRSRWIRRADKTWHEKHAVNAERDRWRAAALAGCDGTHPKYAEALRNLVAMMDAGVGPNVELSGLGREEVR